MWRISLIIAWPFTHLPPRRPHITNVNNPFDVATDSLNNIYIVDTGNSRLVVLSSATGTPRYINNLNQPTGVAVSSSGVIYVVEQGLNRVAVYTSIGATPTFIIGFNQPYGITIDALGTIYVAEYGNDRIAVITSTSATPTYITGFRTPSDVYVDNLGIIYVSDFNNYRVAVLSSSGDTRDYIADTNAPFSVTVDSAGLIYFTNAAGGQVLIYQRDSPSPASTLGDPRFVGLNGQTFQVHGVDGQVYVFISDLLVHMNTRFSFLDDGECPVFNNVKATNCWAHPGSYVGALSIQSLSGDKLLIESGDFKTGFSGIKFNNLNLIENNNGSSEINAQKQICSESTNISIPMISSHRLSICAGLYQLEIENSDNFLNIVSIEVLNWSRLVSSVRSHGLLGQTWKVLKGAERGEEVNEISGRVDDYAVSENEMFGLGSLYTKFVV